MEFPLLSVYYLYNYYVVCALLFYTHHVTFPYCDCDTCDMTLSCTPSYVVSPKEKKRKVNINNDLAVLPSYDNFYRKFFSSITLFVRLLSCSSNSYCFCILLSVCEFFETKYHKVFNGPSLDFWIGIKLNLEEGIEDVGVDELGWAA